MVPDGGLKSEKQIKKTIFWKSDQFLAPPSFWPSQGQILKIKSENQWKSMKIDVFQLILRRTDAIFEVRNRKKCPKTFENRQKLEN